MAVGQLDGRTVVVSGSSDQTVRVWDAATGTPVGDPFTGHTGCGETRWRSGSWTGAPWWSPAASDETVRVWDAATGAPVGEPVHRPHRLR